MSKLIEDTKISEGFLKIHQKTFEVERYNSFDNMTVQREVIAYERPVVAVLAVDYKAGKFLLVEQWRAGSNSRLLELVAGYVDEGETLEEAALREFKEETRAQAIAGASLISSVYTSPGVSEEMVHIMEVEYKSGSHTSAIFNANEQEDIKVHEFDFNDISALLKELDDAKTKIALLELRFEVLKMIMGD